MHGPYISHVPPIFRPLSEAQGTRPREARKEWLLSLKRGDLRGTKRVLLVAQAIRLRGASVRPELLLYRTVPDSEQMMTSEYR